MSVFINKTGQGSFSDPQDNMHSTACVHMAKLSPSHSPTLHGFIHTPHWEEPLAHASSQTMPGRGLVSRQQSQGKEHRNNYTVWMMQGSA